MSVKVAFPRSPEELTSDWLTASLRSGGALPADTRVIGFETIPLGEGAGLMGVVVRIVPQYHGLAGPRSIVGKFSTTNEANQNTAAAMDLYGREVRFYTEIAPGVKGRCPTCYHAELRDDARECVLLLEDFPDHRVGDQVAGASLADARGVMIEAARLHAAYWGADRPAGVPEFGSDWAFMVRAGVAAAWPGMVARHAEVMPDYLQALRDEYVEKVAPFHSSLSDTGPGTVVHGDLRLDNLLFGPGPDAVDPVVMIDFQAPLWSKGVQDLAYFLTQSLDVDLRRAHERELLDGYRTELGRLGVSYDTDTLWEDYRVGALAMFSIAVMISGLEPPNERAAHFMRVTVQRASAAFDDLGLLGLLRDGVTGAVLGRPGTSQPHVP